MATTVTHKTITATMTGRRLVCKCSTRQEYLDALSLVGTIHDWYSLRIGVLTCEVSGSGTDWFGISNAPHDPDQRGLQTHQVSSANSARAKSVATMRAWVVRNVQDEASLARKNSVALTKAEERAMTFFHPQFGGHLVRYRGGKWARPGLKMVGELPEDAPGVGIAVLRRLVLKGHVVLDETKGEARRQN